MYHPWTSYCYSLENKVLRNLGLTIHCALTLGTTLAQRDRGQASTLRPGFINVFAWCHWQCSSSTEEEAALGSVVFVEPLTPPSLTDRWIRRQLWLVVSPNYDFGPVRLSDNPYFSACFFSRNSIFLSQQIHRNSVSACFFSEANRAIWLG